VREGGPSCADSTRAFPNLRQILNAQVVDTGKLSALGVTGFHKDDKVKLTYLGDHKFRIEMPDGKLKADFVYKPVKGK
jgi:hypothetical protein